MPYTAQSCKPRISMRLFRRADLLKRIGEMVETGIEARDYTWLVRALDQLKVARGVLSNSYAFAYFFFGGELLESG